MTKVEKLLLHILFGVFVLAIASFWKIQTAFGTHSWSFTASNIFGPLLGTILGPWTMLLAVLLKRFVAWSFFGFPLLSTFTTYIPTLCAAGYWNIHSKIIIRLMVPLCCMIAFIAHPIGFPASIYSFYWLIPVVLYFVQPKSFFLNALAATFIQHAVGSIIWLYFIPTTPMLWYSLLPVVCVERLLLASGMVLTMHGVSLCRHIAFHFLSNQRILAKKH